MDIFNNTKRPIRCISNRVYAIDGSNAHLLERGRIYNLDYIEVYDWFSYVYLTEFPGVHFNSVLFEEID